MINTENAKINQARDSQQPNILREFEPKDVED